LEEDAPAKKPPFLLIGGVLVVLAVAALLFTVLPGSSSSSQQNSAGVNGEPTLTLAAPIMASACTLDDTCLVLGSSSGKGTGLTSGQVATGSEWESLSLPKSNSATFSGSSCWHSGCIIYGSTIDGDLLWRYQSGSNTVVALTPPSPSPSVEGLSCYASSSCAVIDMGAGDSATHFYKTTDAGATWSTPVATPFDATGLSCTTSKHCLATSNTSTWSTVDGGVTWTESANPTSGLINLACFGESCVARDSGASHNHYWRTSDFGGTWTSALLSGRNFALACLSANRCVSAGTNHAATGVVTKISGWTLSPLSVSYFPNPITTLACGTTRCVAGGLYSVALFKP
jgi:hypothetical protein